MSWSNLMRASGIAAVVAGTLFVVADLLDLLAARSGGFSTSEGTAPGVLIVVQSGLTLLAGVLLLFGLVGLYANRFEETGLLGLFGFVMAFSGTVMAVGAFWGNVSVAPSLAHALVAETSSLVEATPPRALSAGFTLSYGLVAAGWFAFGLGALISRVYPRFPVALLVVGAAVTWLPYPLTGVPFGAAVIWLGCVLPSAGSPGSDELAAGKYSTLG